MTPTGGPTNREWQLLMSKLDDLGGDIRSLDLKNDAQHVEIKAALEGLRVAQHGDHDRLVAMDQGGSAAMREVRDCMNDLKKRLVLLEKEVAVSKAKTAGIGAGGGALVVAIWQAIKAVIGF